MAGSNVIGRYHVLGLLGRGGMGVVFRAEDPNLGRSVALKLLSERLSRDPQAKERLRVEARAASALDHPNICTVYEVNETVEDATITLPEGTFYFPKGSDYISMACYDGVPLDEHIAEDGPFAVERAVAIARQMASGLAAAHRKGIIHRDIKPSNLFLCEDDDGHGERVKILDFGVAKVTGLDLTQTGATVGTVAYAAPEQAHGVVDARSDLWSLGVVLYEMLTGTPPFTGHEAAVIYAIHNADPTPVRERRPEIPEALEAVVERLLAKDPAGRFQTAEAAGAALVEAMADQAETRAAERAETHTPRPAPTPRARTLRPVLLVAAVVPLLLVLVYVLWPQPPSPEERHIAVLPFSFVGADAEGEVFAEGLSELVVSELTMLKRYADALEVIPMGEVRAQDVESAGQAHQALGATLVVSGRVRRDTTRVEVTLDLVDAVNLRQLNSRSFQRPASELDALRGDVVAVLAQMLDVTLQPDAHQIGGTRNSAAFEAYVQGLGFLDDVTPEALEQAVATFERAIEADPQFALAHARLGDAALRLYQETKEPHWIERAQTAAERAIALNPDEPLGYVVQARLYTATGRYDEAVRAAREALTHNPDSDEAYGALAGAYEASGNLGAAGTAYKEAIKRRPGWWWGHNRLGLFHYNHGRPREALQAWEQVTRLMPNLSRGYSNQGGAYLLLGRADSARMMFEHAIARFPTYSALSNLASLYYYEGRYEEATHTYRHALDLDDHNHLTWGGLAVSHERLEQRDQAIEAYREAIHRAEDEHAVNPRDPIPLAHLANYYVSVGDSTRARSVVDQAAALDPDRGETSFDIGLAYEQLGERDEALRWIARALERGFTREEVESTHALAEFIRDPRYTALATRTPQSGG